VDLAPGTKSIFLIEPEAEMRERISRLFLRAGFRVSASGAGGDQLGSGDHDAVVAAIDLDAPDISTRIADLKRLAGPAPLVVLCPPAQVRIVSRALQCGADDYLLRPPEQAEVEVRLARLVERSDFNSRLAYFQDEIAKRTGSKNVEAHSPAMASVVERVRRVAPMRSTVLILGESGVGKELVARAIHFNSPRHEGPFMALNCAAIPSSLIESELFGHEKGSFTGAHSRVRGKFEIAHRGTLFLDEIGEMSPSTQAKLLRVLDEREFMRIGGDQSIRVDVRVIAATNADLAALVERGEFRRDLFYRLKVVQIEVPPLRERREDVPPLVETFLDQLSRANAVPCKSITPEALGALQGYHWPGNVRELKNLVESLLVSVPGEVIRLEDLPRAVRHDRLPVTPSDLSPGTTLAEMERELIRRTLEHTGGNRTHSATLLGIGVRTLQRKIRTYALAIPSKRRRSRRGVVSSTTN